MRRGLLPDAPAIVLSGMSADVRAPSAARFPQERLTWAAPGFTFADLGLADARALFAPEPALLARMEVLEDAPDRLRLRFALPGTPDARGNLSGRPGALGTGWLWLSVFRGGWPELLRARCTHPRSASRAEREWNLLCTLRARGVGTPEPLLVGARGSGFVSSRSFLLVRAPEDAFPLPRWLRTDGIGAERARGLEALGKTLALLSRSGVELPGLAARDLWLTPSGSGECETHAGEAGPRKNKLPSVAVVEVRGGRLRARAAERSAFPRGLLEGTDLAPEERRRVEALAGR